MADKSNSSDEAARREQQRQDMLEAEQRALDAERQKRQEGK